VKAYSFQKSKRIREAGGRQKKGLCGEEKKEMKGQGSVAIVGGLLELTSSPHKGQRA